MAKPPKNPRKPKKPVPIAGHSKALAKIPKGKKKEEPITALAIIPKISAGPPPREESRREAGWDPVFEAEKAGVAEEYVKHIKHIVDAQKATDTEFFRKLYREQKTRLTDIGLELVEVDKSTDLHRIQGEAKYIQRLLKSYRAPVDALNDYIAANPLFADKMPLRAEWNTALGKIVIRDL